MDNNLKYMFNFIWLGISNIAILTSSIITGILIVRLLGPATLGQWSYATSIWSIITVFNTLGIQQIFIRESIKNHNDKQKDLQLLQNTIFIRIIGGIFACILIVIYVIFSSDVFSIKISILILSFSGIFSSWNTFGYLFQAKLISKYESIVVTSNLFISVISKIIVLIYFNSIINLAIVMLLTALSEAILFNLIGKTKLQFPNEKFKFNIKLSKYILIQSFPLFISGIATLFYLQIDKVMLKMYKTDIDVGYYASASMLIGYIMMIISVVGQALYPSVVEAKSKGDCYLKSHLQKIYLIELSIGIVLGFISFILAPLIIPILFGEAYNSSIPIFQLLSFIGIFNGITLVSSYYMMVNDLQRYSMYRNIAGMLINIFANLILIPLYGGLGAAISTLIARFTTTFGFMLVTPKLRNQTFWMIIAFNKKNIILVFNIFKLLAKNKVFKKLN